MWALLAPIMRWPLYSPRRLVAVVAGLITVVMIMGNCSGGDEPPADVGPTPTSTATATAPTSPTPSSTASPATTKDENEEVGGLTDEDATATHDQVSGEVAAGFITAWARPDLTADAWMQGLRPIITDRLASELEGADPATAPALSVVAEPIPVDTSADTVTFDVQTTGGMVRVHMVDVDGTWLTDRLELP